MRRVLAAILAVALVCWPAAAAAQGLQRAQTAEADVAAGIRQVDEGDFDAALITLDGAVRRLQGQPGKSRELGRAYLYLGIAYLGLSQEQSARTCFLDAIRQDGSLDVKATEFPPRVVRLFEEARREADRGSTPATRPSPAAAPAPAPPQKKGGGGHTTLLVVGGLALVGGGVAVAAVAGGSRGPQTMTFTSTDAPRAILDFTTVNSTINVGGLNGRIISVVLSVNITHTFISDLVIGLRGPVGSEVILHNREGGATANLVMQYNPGGFAGQPANGVWTLRVSDQVAGDSGRLNSWSLQITVQP